MEFAGKGIKGTLTSFRMEPNKSYTELDIQGIGKVQGKGAVMALLPGRLSGHSEGPP